MKKIPLLIAAGVGYVLGARAGRGRYEQIKAGAHKLADDPRVQAAKDRATDAAKEKAGEMAHAAADKVRRETSIQAHPDPSPSGDGRAVPFAGAARHRLAG